MDIYSLAITHVRKGVRAVRMSAWAEDRYYLNHIALPHFRPGMLASIAMPVGAVLIVGIALI